MSYDLMVFETSAAPRERKAFLDWFEQQSEWQESHGYNNPEIPSPALRKWFRAMIETFPPMNGPLASDDPDDPCVTDYSLGRSVIYATFAGSQAVDAYKAMKELAVEHGVGFFDVSGNDGAIWWPVKGWKLTCEAKGEIPLPLDLSFEELMTGLDPRSNSFYILEHESGDYIQCGGSAKACTVEFRRYAAGNEYEHYVVGHANGSSRMSAIKMSQGEVEVRKGEILTGVEAAEMFGLFFARKAIPGTYALRQKAI